jgi:hypothetical protein
MDRMKLDEWLDPVKAAVAAKGGAR